MIELGLNRRVHLGSVELMLQQLAFDIGLGPGTACGFEIAPRRILGTGAPRVSALPGTAVLLRQLRDIPLGERQLLTLGAQLLLEHAGTLAVTGRKLFRHPHGLWIRHLGSERSPPLCSLELLLFGGEESLGGGQRIAQDADRHSGFEEGGVQLSSPHSGVVRR